MHKRPIPDLTRLALRVVIDAAARAQGGIVERNWGHRLALTHLVRQRIALPWQAAHFWEHLAREHLPSEFEHGASYIDTTVLTGCINNWCYAAGVELPDLRRLGRRYFPDLEIEAGTQDNPAMCNRYRPGERDTIRSLFDARMLREFNEGPEIVHPKDPAWVVRLAEGERVMDQMTWGFPTYIRSKAGVPLKPRPTNNARIEKLGGYWKHWAEKPEHRCLIPTAAWAEAVGPAGEMTTTWLSLDGVPMFAWAGLWRESDEWGACYTGVMTQSDERLASIHERSPVILRPDEWETWLEAPLADLLQFDRRYPASEIKVEPTRKLWGSGKEAPLNTQGGLLSMMNKE